MAIAIIPRTRRVPRAGAHRILMATMCLTFAFYGYSYSRMYDYYLSHGMTQAQIIPVGRSIAGDLLCLCWSLAVARHTIVILLISSFIHFSRLFVSASSPHSLRFHRIHSTRCRMHTGTQAQTQATARTIDEPKVFTTTETPAAAAAATPYTHLLLIKTNFFFFSFGLASVRWFVRFFLFLFFFVCSDFKRIGSLCIYIRCTISDIVTHSVSRA